MNRFFLTTRRFTTYNKMDVQKCKKLLYPVYTIQPVVKPVVQSVWQQAVSCKQTSNRLSNGFDNRFDNRLYRVNGALAKQDFEHYSSSNMTAVFSKYFQRTFTTCHVFSSLDNWAFQFENGAYTGVSQMTWIRIAMMRLDLSVVTFVMLFWAKTGTLDVAIRKMACSENRC